MGAILPHLSRLKELKFVNTGFNKYGMCEIMKGVNKSSTITTLYIECSYFQEDTWETFLRELDKNTSLTHLTLWGQGEYGIKNARLESLLEVLERKTSFTFLNLNDNDVRNEGAIALAKFLHTHTCFKHLYLIDNNIGIEGATALAKALEVNTSLTLLDVRRNSIQNDGAAALAAMLRINKSLTSLYMYGNKIDNDGAMILAHSIERNYFITELGISDTDIDRKGYGYTFIQTQTQRNVFLEEMRQHNIATHVTPVTYSIFGAISDYLHKITMNSRNFFSDIFKAVTGYDLVIPSLTDQEHSIVEDLPERTMYQVIEDQMKGFFIFSLGMLEKDISYGVMLKDVGKNTICITPPAESKMSETTKENIQETLINKVLETVYREYDKKKADKQISKTQENGYWQLFVANTSERKDTLLSLFS